MLGPHLMHHSVDVFLCCSHFVAPIYFKYTVSSLGFLPDVNDVHITEGSDFV